MTCFSWGLSRRDLSHTFGSSGRKLFFIASSGFSSILRTSCSTLVPGVQNTTLWGMSSGFSKVSCTLAPGETVRSARSKRIWAVRVLRVILTGSCARSAGAEMASRQGSSKGLSGFMERREAGERWVSGEWEEAGGGISGCVGGEAQPEDPNSEDPCDFFFCFCCFPRILRPRSVRLPRHRVTRRPPFASPRTGGSPFPV